MKVLPLLLLVVGFSLNHAFAQEIFRLRYVADDLDLTNPAKNTFQIDTLDVRLPSSFLKIGEMLPRTKLKLESFARKTALAPQGKEIDASELTLRNTATGELFILPKYKIVNVPGAVTPK